MKLIHNYRRQRGEVASFLTIVSMVVLSVGLLVGYQLNRSTSTINPAPRAASPAPSKPIPPEGVDQHDEVCFPGGDKNKQVRDTFCRIRMMPATITRDVIQSADARAKQVFNKIFTGTDQSKQNPYITAVTSRDLRTFQIYGGLCLNRSSIAGTKISTEDVEVYVSLFGVRKFYTAKDRVDIGDKDKNAVLRYKIAAAEDKVGSDNTDELFVAQAAQDVCSFTNGKVDASDYTGIDNPLLFNIQMSKKSLENAIANAKKDTTIDQKFDTEACEVYIHLRDNTTAGDKTKPKDTYNIFKLSLRDVLGDEANVLCPPSTGTPTPPVDSPTPSVTATVTPPDQSNPSPTPQFAQCYERCSSQITCGINPLTKERLLCLNSEGIGIPPALPTGDVDAGSNRPGVGLAPCQSADAECLCLPQKCQFDSSTCGSPEEACRPTGGGNPTPTKTVPSIVTPTTPPPSVTTTITPPQACTFDALAYVQECAKFDKHGQCVRSTDGRFIANPISAKTLGGTWGASNNKQISGGRYGENPATLFTYEQATFVGAFDALKLRFPFYSDKSISSLSYLDYQATAEVAPGKSLTTKGSANDLTPAGRAANPILIAPFNAHPNEQYFNFENASVRLYANFANKEYRIVPDGNEIAFCKNNIVGNTIGACDMTEFTAKRVDDSMSPSEAITQNRDVRDTIAGLTVGCGQNIVYGWTLEKCNNEPADYVFVIDTSSSMTTGRDISGSLKIDAAKTAIKEFLGNVKSFSKDSRAALVQFSSTRNTGTVEPLTQNIDQVISAVDTKLKYESGTCIEDGLRETISLLKANNSTRKTYVVFLTDGMPNCPDGNPNPASEEVIKGLGTELRAVANTTIYGIGVGDPNKTGVDPDTEMLRVIQYFTSTPDLAFSTTSEVSIAEIYNNIQVGLNSCAKSDALYANYISSQDINGDGVINTIDLFLIYDNYYARGQNVPEDLNGDSIVNSLDVSIIVNNLGKTVPQENNTAQKTLGDVFN